MDEHILTFAWRDILIIETFCFVFYELISTWLDKNQFQFLIPEFSTYLIQRNSKNADF